MKQYANNSIEFNHIDTRLSSLGFSNGQKHVIYVILSAILNLGNLEFQNELHSSDCCVVTEESQPFLDNVALLLNMNRSTLQHAFTSRVISVAGSEIQ